ncbi:MAG TPA: hypothetical protein VGV59_14610, partial [Pyrinomonadaceae bacterium]|nr:hypothetical protein [Pyrinomonadaceae bacterium]
SEAYEIVVGTIRKELALEATGRPAKSTTSICDKLRRESIRLTQIQDIAGCRLIVADIAHQDAVVQSLVGLFEDHTVIDRRERPSHGYSAVHVIVHCRGKMIEIQVRTALQHLWAELSEKLSDIEGSAIKYGGGDAGVRAFLKLAYHLVATVESAEILVAHTIPHALSRADLTDDKKQELIVNEQERLHSTRRNVFNQLRYLIEQIEG